MTRNNKKTNDDNKEGKETGQVHNRDPPLNGTPNKREKKKQKEGPTMTQRKLEDTFNTIASASASTIATGHNQKPPPVKTWAGVTSERNRKPPPNETNIAANNNDDAKPAVETNIAANNDDDAKPAAKTDDSHTAATVISTGSSTTSKGGMSTAQANAQAYVYDYHADGKYKPTKEWTETVTLVRAASKPFDRYEAFDIDDDCIHNAVAKDFPYAVGQIDPTMQNLGHYTKEVLLQAAAKAWKERKTDEKYQKLLTTMRRLAKTSPEVFEDIGHYNNVSGRLLYTKETAAWWVANKWYGSHWTFTKQPTKPQPKKIQFDPATVAITQLGTFRLVPDKPAAKKSTAHTKSKYERKHKTYMKITLPRTMDPAKAETEAIAYFNLILEMLFNLDPNTVLLQFPTKRWADAPPHTRKDGKFQMKSAIEPYTSRFYVNPGQWTYSTIIIGHDIDRDEFDANEFQEQVKESRLTLKVEPIQAAATAIAGWFVGSHVPTFNMISFAQAMKVHEKCSTLELDYRSQSIRVEYREEPRSTKAIHVICAQDKVATVRKALIRVFNKNTGSPPEGRNMRFVPYTANKDDMRPTRSKRNDIDKAVAKQKEFLENVKSMEIRSARNPDIPAEVTVAAGEKKRLTLRQALLCTRYSEDNRLPLLIMVEQRWDGTVLATYHETVENEATMFLTYLPLLLASRFGPRAWSWFNEAEAKETMSGYFYNETTHTIEDIENDDDEPYESYTSHIRGDEHDQQAERRGWAIEDDDEIEEEAPITFHLEMQIDIQTPLVDIQPYDETQSLASMVTGCTTVNGDLNDTTTTLIDNLQSTNISTTPVQHIDLTEDSSAVSSQITTSTTTGSQPQIATATVTPPAADATAMEVDNE